MYGTRARVACGRAWRGRHAEITALAFSADGQRLAVADAGFVTVWSFTQSRPLASLDCGKDSPGSVAWSPDGRMLAIRTSNAVLLWDAQGPRPSLTLKPPPGGQVGFGAGGRLLLAGTSVFETATGRPFFAPRLSERVHATSIAPDGRSMILASFTEVSTVAIPSGRILARQPCAGLTTLVMAPDGETVAVAPLRPLGRIQLMGATRVRPVRSLDGRSERISAVAFTSDARTLVARSLEGTVVLWDLAAGRPRRILAQGGDNWTLPGLPISLRGTLLVVPSPDHVDLYDLATSQRIATLPGTRFRSACISADGRHVLTGETSGRVAVWTAQGQPVAEWTPVAGIAPACMAASPDGRTLAMCLSRRIEEWDLPTRTLVARHPLDAMPVGLAYSPDGTRLACVTRDDRIHLLAPRTVAAPDLLCQVEGVSPVLRGVQRGRQPARCWRHPEGGGRGACHAQGPMLPAWWQRRVPLPGLQPGRPYPGDGGLGPGLDHPILGPGQWPGPGARP